MPRDCCQDLFTCELGEALFQRGALLVSLQRVALHIQERASIKPHIHQDGADTRLAVSRKDRGRDRTCPAELWQQRRVQIQDAARERVNECAGNDLSKICKEPDRCAELHQRLECCRIPQSTSFQKVKPLPPRPLGYRCWLRFAAPSGSARGRADNGDDVEVRIGVDGVEGG